MIDTLTVLVSSILGYKSYDLLSKFMLVGDKAINYYAEAHLSKWNSWIHTLGMPFSMYGMLLWIPALLNLNPAKAKLFIVGIYFFYGGHYIRISKLGALLYFLQYYLTIKFALKKWNSPKKPSNLKLLTNGLIISSTSLCCQEFFGHWLGGDIASRPKAVPNAMIYAMYFSATHFLKK